MDHEIIAAIVEDIEAIARKIDHLEIGMDDPTNILSRWPETTWRLIVSHQDHIRDLIQFSYDYLGVTWEGMYD
jgi:hypothetical protein